MGPANTQVLHEAIDQLHPSDFSQVLDFIGYLNNKRGIRRLKPNETEEERQAAIAQALSTLQKLGTFAHITDPGEWQREIRKDRPLPGREG